MKARPLMFAVLILALATSAIAADDPFIGTWKWISSAPPEPWPPGSWWTAKIEIQGNGYHIVQDGAVGGDTLHMESTDIFDGKEHALKGNQSADATLSTRINTYAYESVNMKEGKEVVRMHFSVSKDGKTLTISRQNKNPEGKDVTLTRLMVKQ